MKIPNAVHSSDIYNLCQGMQDYGIHVLAKESSEESIQAILKQKGVNGVVTLDSMNESMIFALHRLRPNGTYIKESFSYDLSLQKWHFRNGIDMRCSKLKNIFDYIFSPLHEKFI